MNASMLVGARARGARWRAQVGAALVACAIAAPHVARADERATRAHDAYERATAAQLRGDYATAAREFATADAIAPNPTALQAAIDAVVLADDPVLGTELLERARRAPITGALADSARAAATRFAGRTGRIRVTCGVSAACLGAIDGVAVEAGKATIVRVGPHSITIQVGGQSEPHLVDLRAGETVDVAPSPPRVIDVAAAPRGYGVSPAWFFVALGATAIAGGVALGSGIDTGNQHAQFVRAGCDRAPLAGCASSSSSGASAQTRTNILLGVTGALAAATAVVGLFVVRWHGLPPATLSVGLVRGAPGALLGLSL